MKDISAPTLCFLRRRFLNSYRPPTCRLHCRWATAFIKASSVHDFDFHRKSLGDIILVRGWEEFERSDLTQHFVEHVFSRLKDGGDLFRGTDTRRQEAFSEELESNVAKRRAFLVAAGKARLWKF